MKLFWFAAVCAIGMTLSAGTGRVSAQPPVPGGGFSRPPAFSPYLNLLRAGGSPALNYYGLVRPEVQFRQSLQNIANDVSLNQAAIGNLEATGNATSATGHGTQFMNLGGYFMNNSGGGGQIGGGGRGPTMTPPIGAQRGGPPSGGRR